jgi:hypothetical protein
LGPHLTCLCRSHTLSFSRTPTTAIPSNVTSPIFFSGGVWLRPASQPVPLALYRSLMTSRFVITVNILYLFILIVAMICYQEIMFWPIKMSPEGLVLWFKRYDPTKILTQDFIESFEFWLKQVHSWIYVFFSWFVIVNLISCWCNL